MCQQCAENPSDIGNNNVHSLFSRNSQYKSDINTERDTNGVHTHACVRKDIHRITNSSYFWVGRLQVFSFALLYLSVFFNFLY